MKQKIHAISSAPNEQGKPLPVLKRRRRICEMVEASERMTVEELSGYFDLSVGTIRNDLNVLAAIGALVRIRSGALAHRKAEDLSVGVMQHGCRPEMLLIAAAAVIQIKDGQTIMLDSGTTTGYIAQQIRNLKLQSINVITNALDIAGLLADVPHVTLIMLGGVLRPSSNALCGPQAEAALRSLHADILFLGFDGLDPEIGVMTQHLPEAHLNIPMIQIARRVVLVGDSSNVGRRSLSVIAQIKQIDQIITDAGANPAIVKALRKHAVDVVLV